VNIAFPRIADPRIPVPRIPNLALMTANYSAPATLERSGRLRRAAMWWLCDGRHTSFMCESDERHIGGWVGTGGARLAYCDWLLWRSAAVTATLNRLESWFEQWTDATKTMPLSRNLSKSAENLRCRRYLLMYLQLTRSVHRYLTAHHRRRPNAGMPFVSPQGTIEYA